MSLPNDDKFDTPFFNWLVVEPTHLKNMLVKLEIFPKFQGEHKIFETTT